MSFGYIGDISTKIKQQVKNTGILSISEAFDLERQGFLGGSIELIQSQTVSGVASVQFTSIKGSEYDNHLMECVNLSLDSDNSNIRFDVRFSSDGGSSFPFLQRGDRVGKSSDVYEATTNVAMVSLNVNDQLRIQYEEGDLHVNTGYNYFQGYLLG